MNPVLPLLSEQLLYMIRCTIDDNISFVAEII